MDYVKTELMPDFDFDAFNHDTPFEGEEGKPESTEVAPAPAAPVAETPVTPVAASTTPADNGSTEEVDRW